MFVSVFISAFTQKIYQNIRRTSSEMLHQKKAKTTIANTTGVSVNVFTKQTAHGLRVFVTRRMKKCPCPTMTSRFDI